MTGGGARLEPALKAPAATAQVEDAFAFPLSFSQQRLWFLDQLDPGNSAYLLPRVIELVGDLDEGVLEACLAEVVRRHEVLRSRIATLDGEPVQLVVEGVRVHLPRIDLAGLSPERARSEARRLSRAEAQRALPLERAPLLRVTLLRLAPREHRLLLTMHHIVSDGWSTGVLIREVTVLYRAFSGGEPSPLPELPIQYGDFADWQRSWLQGEVLEEMVAYWRRELGEPAPLDLPQARPRPEDQAHKGAHIERFLPPVEGLKRLARGEEATLFMALLAAFQAVVHRWSGRRDVVVGSPVANRTRPELEDLIGFFVNTLVLRTDFDGSPGFRELLGRVRRVTLGAYAHQDLPFEKLVETLRPERSLSRTPLFQVMFILQNAPRGALELPGLSVAEIAAEAAVSPFDMTLIATETPAGLALSLKYDVALFDRTTMERLIRHLQRMVELVTEEPDRPIPALPLLDRVELHQVVVEWGDLEPRAAVGGDLRGLAGPAAEGARRVHLLGPWLEPVPPGAGGEMALGPGGQGAGGAGPGETAARTIPDPFGPPGGRLLLTGKRARFSGSGRLEPERPGATGPGRTQGRGSRAEFVPPSGRDQEVLAGIWREVLKVDQVGVEDNFFELGGDSILSIQVVAKARREGIRLTVKDLFRHQTIARVLRATGGTDADRGEGRQALPVTPWQQRVLDAGAEAEVAETVWLSPRERLDAAALASALGDLAARHDALRLRLTSADGARPVQAAVAEEGARLLGWLDLGSVRDRALPPLTEDLVRQLARTLDPARGPMLRSVLVRGGPSGDQLLVAVHGLALDPWSWEPLLADLSALYVRRTGRDGPEPRLSAAPRFLHAWADRVGAAKSARRNGGGTGAGWTATPPWRPRAGDAVPQAAVAAAASVEEVLLASLAWALARHEGGHEVRISVEDPGRGDPSADLHHAVGPFAVDRPLILRTGPRPAPEASLAAAKQARRFAPGATGAGNGEAAEADPGGVLLTVREVPGRGLGEDAPFRVHSMRRALPAVPGRLHLHLAAEAGDSGGLLLRWAYRRDATVPETIAELSHLLDQALAAVTEHCRASAGARYSPADFPLASVDQQELDGALGELELDDE